MHFGYEISQRVAGNLFPLWGMQTIEARLLALLADYNPVHLVLLGDLVHDRAGANAFFALVRRLRRHCEVVLISGNHDRHIKLAAGRVRLIRHGTDSSDRRTGRHQKTKMKRGDIDLVGFVAERWFLLSSRRLRGGIGRLHSSDWTSSSGWCGARRRGLAIETAGACATAELLDMPAFSPWAAGSEWPQDADSRVWLCSPQRVLLLNETRGALGAVSPKMPVPRAPMLNGCGSAA